MIKARYGTLPLIERLTGEVKAKNQIAIYPEISAVITQVNVKNGDVVKKGQIMLYLRDKEFQERLKQAQANHRIAVAQARQAEAELNRIEAELRRTKELAASGLASSAELETIETRAISADANLELAKARVEQAQATLDERKEMLRQTTVRAPISGTVGSRNAEVGMLVTGNTRLFTLGQLDNVRVEVVLTDRMLNYIEAGQRMEIFTENTDFEVMTARLSRISPFLHPVTHSTIAEVDMANPSGQLKPGMFTAVDIFYGESEMATLVPLSALYDHPSSGVTGIYVCQDTLKENFVDELKASQSTSLTKPLSFDFVPVEIIAKGRMEVAIRGIDGESYVITIGQDLLGGKPGKARARPVNWGWVERLQNLQQQDLLQSVLKRQQEVKIDTSISLGNGSHLGEGRN
ncbi:efflux RND transporter periplasmic adaptor subunit [candidate division KSB1 bacterium]|nr:efflux RND transporter periplasmic adaptor subunit [candidate division KSB1 bacterium]